VSVHTPTKQATKFISYIFRKTTQNVTEENARQDTIKEKAFTLTREREGERDATNLVI